MNVGFIQLQGLLLHHSDAHLHTRLAQMIKTAAGNFRVWVFDGSDHAFDARLNQRVGAGRGAALMSVRLKRDVGSSATCFLSRSFERNRFGMLDFIVEIKPLTDYVSGGVDNDGAD